MLILIFGQHYIKQFYDIEKIRIMTSINTPLESLQICKYIWRLTLCPEAKKIGSPQLLP